MAIGTLGKQIVFEVSDKRALTFGEMGREVTSRWATHEALGVKPRAGFLGPGSQTVTLPITLSATLGVRPREILRAIERMVESGAAEYLIIGNAPVGSGPFRLTGSSETWDHVYRNGELSKASLTITLEEYA